MPKKFQENEQKVTSPPENNLPMKWKFHSEPKKPPMNGSHKCHQDLWSNRELKKYAAYREETCAKHKNMSVMGGPNPKIRRMDLQSPSSGNLQGKLREDPGLQSAELALSDTIGEHSPASGRSEENEEEEEGSRSSAPNSEDEDGDSEPEDHSSNSSSSGDSSH